MFRRTLLAIAALGLAGSALAQTTDGYGTIIRLPIVVNSTTYGSTIYVRNNSNVTANIAVNYLAGAGSAVASKSCGLLNVGAGQTVEATFSSLCAMPVPGATQFGQLHLEELNTQNVPFTAYSRVQTFSANGFSVEGFKLGSITGNANGSYATVSGLRRQAGAPGYSSNCFVASTGEAVDVSWELRTGAGALLGASQLAVVPVNGLVRLTDVFTLAGAPAGDHGNVTARFLENSGANEPGFMAFCTVQNNTSFDADFRVAKDPNPTDETREKVTFSSTTGLGATLQLATVADQHVLGLYLQHPDWVQCSLSATTLSNFEMRLKDPDGNVVVGGNDVTSFGEVYLGAKSTRNNGVNGLWRLEVESANGLETFPSPYTISCQSGNGGNRPLLIGVESQEF